MSEIKIVKQIVIKNPNDLIPYENNARINDHVVPALMNSIERFGFNQPVVIDRSNIIVCGHTRIKAAIRLGMTEVPCVYAEGLTQKEIDAYRLADNKVAEQALWDYEKLNNELAKIGKDINMADFSFNIDESGMAVQEPSYGGGEQMQHLPRGEGGGQQVGGGEDEDEDEALVAGVGNAQVQQKQQKSQKNDEFRYFTDDEIIADMQHEFRRYDTVEEFVKNIMSIPKAKHQFNRLCQGYNDGYNISLLFNPHRLDTPTLKSKSVFDAYNNNEKYRLLLTRFALCMMNKMPVERDMYKYVGLGSGGVQYVNEFIPSVARSIYLHYCKEGYAVLDPCSGWGGRTIGLASCLFKDIRYITSDPNTRTYRGLLKLKDFLKLGDNFEYHNCGFEDLPIEDESIDFCFTSPPYFDTERYSTEPTQSYVKNDSYDKWKVNFLYVMLEKIMRSLKHERYALLNVGACKYPIDKDIMAWLDERKIPYDLRDEFKIGGCGIGQRANTNASRGEPFIEFYKK